MQSVIFSVVPLTKKNKCLTLMRVLKKINVFFALMCKFKLKYVFAHHSFNLLELLSNLIFLSNFVAPLTFFFSRVQYNNSFSQNYWQNALFIVKSFLFYVFRLFLFTINSKLYYFAVSNWGFETKVQNKCFFLTEKRAKWVL